MVIHHACLVVDCASACPRPQVLCTTILGIHRHLLQKYPILLHKLFHAKLPSPGCKQHWDQCHAAVHPNPHFPMILPSKVYNIMFCVQENSDPLNVEEAFSLDHTPLGIVMEVGEVLRRSRVDH